MADIDNLPLTSSHWGTYAVETKGGKVIALHDFSEDDAPSPIGHGIVDVLDGPSRITAPMVRQSFLESGPGTATEKRGAEPFVEVSWDQVEELVADELNRVCQDFGNQAIYGFRRKVCLVLWVVVVSGLQGQSTRLSMRTF